LLDDYQLTIDPMADMKARSQQISQKLFQRFENNKNLNFVEVL
jgi:hypothetical protein